MDDKIDETVDAAAVEDDSDDEDEADDEAGESELSGGVLGAVGSCCWANRIEPSSAVAC